MLLVGLGNPGREYAGTRHNVGFLVLDEVARRVHADSPRRAHRGLLSQASHGGHRLLLLWPQTYMNLSGESVRAAASYFKLPAPSIVVVYDDLDLAFGRIRVREGGSAGGHNGMKSVIAELGTQQFPRVRVGISRPSPARTMSYVLGRWTTEELEQLPQVIDRAASAVLRVVEDGIITAMNEFNGQ